MAVYKAVCLSVLLYSSDCWVLYRRHLKLLERFHIQCLQRIVGLKWWHRVAHVEIRRKANIDPIESLLVERQLRWVGHVRRMSPDRLPRRIYFSELAEGIRDVGGLRKRHKDLLASNLRKCDIPSQHFEQLANDRDCWKTTCSNGVAIYTEKFNEAARARRARRHQPGAQPQQIFTCVTCGRACGSRIGLHWLIRVHTTDNGRGVTPSSDTTGSFK